MCLHSLFIYYFLNTSMRDIINETHVRISWAMTDHHVISVIKAVCVCVCIFCSSVSLIAINEALNKCGQQLWRIWSQYSCQSSRLYIDWKITAALSTHEKNIQSCSHWVLKTSIPAVDVSLSLSLSHAQIPASHSRFHFLYNRSHVI